MSISRIVLPTQAGSIFPKKHETSGRKTLGSIKISSKRYRIHQDFIKIMSDTSLKSLKEATRSNNTHICGVFLRSSLGGMEGIKGERDEQQSDRAENHDQNGLYLGRFEVQKVRVFI